MENTARSVPYYFRDLFIHRLHFGRLSVPRFHGKSHRGINATKLSFRKITEIQLDYTILFWENINFYATSPKLRHNNILPYSVKGCQLFFDTFLYYFLALSLFVALALGADNHNSAVSLDNFALIAHRFYRRSNFHCNFSLLIKSLSSLKFYDLLRHVILPFVKSYGLISNFTVSPSMILI